MGEGEHRGDRGYEERMQKIRKQALSDAFDYIALMRKKLRKKPVLDEHGEITLDFVALMPIFNRAKKALGLEDYERPEYFLLLADRVKEMLSGKKP